MKKVKCDICKEKYYEFQVGVFASSDHDAIVVCFTCQEDL